MSVIEKDVILRNSRGLHARPAALIVKTARMFKAEIAISKESDTVNGKSIMGVLMLAAPSGTLLNIRAEGEDAEEAVSELTKVIEMEMEY
ncbi:HPr family phosphocarrier protein [bacterium]|nr:HPr family phosphocarrier protein [bacterium]